MARGQRRLVTAVGAFEQRAAAFFPDPRALAVRAAGLAAPAGLDPVGAAVGFGGEALLELDRRLREITPQ